MYSSLKTCVDKIMSTVEGQTDRRADRQTDGRTDERIDIQTDRVKPIYPPQTSFEGK